jgi:uncharacterized membrane protein YbhN (UPF0104 family)
MSDRIRRIVGRKRVLLAMLVSVAILVALAWQTGVRVDKIWERLGQVDWGVLIGAFVFSLSWHIFVGADKWWRILRAQGAPVSYWEVFRVRLGSDPVRLAVPFKVGEVVNAAYFGKIKSFGFSRAAGSIAFDKSLNLFGTVFWLYVGITAMAEVPTAEYLALHTAVGAAVLVLICVRPARQAATALAGILHPKLGRFAAGVLSAFEEFSLAKKVGFLLYGIVFQLRPLVVCYLLFAATCSDGLPSRQEFLAYGSVVVLMGNMPLTVAGIGPREVALASLFSAYGDQASLFLIGLMMSFSIHVLPAILGIPLMFPLLQAVTPGAEEETGRRVRRPISVEEGP